MEYFDKIIPHIEYEGMFIPEKFKPMLGHVTREQLAYYIKFDKAVDSYVLQNQCPITLVKKVFQLFASNIKYTTHIEININKKKHIINLIKKLTI